MLTQSRLYELCVRPLGRSIADEYYHNGNTWIEGREGNTYTIQISNNSPNRALFIISVDGLDVISGQPAGPNSQGYVLDAGHVVNIPGWNLNNNSAAEFYFSRTRDSYVNLIGGSTASTGVIGAMVFEELTTKLISQKIGDYYHQGTAVHPFHGMPMNTSNRAVAASVTNGMHDSASLGTGFGNSVEWNTSAIVFNKAAQPVEILVIYYNSAKNLERMGIQLRKKRDISYTANPFPNYTPGCSPPPGWKG